jgi:Putative Actinobacterial Holin-X, holin superfamily III
MEPTQRANEIVGDGRDHSEPQWPELVSRAVNDLSRIVHAEIRLAELGIKNLIEREIDHSIKIVIALGFLLCAGFCALGAALIGLHALLGVWWGSFAIVAAISAVAGIGFLQWSRRRPKANT